MTNLLRNQWEASPSHVTDSHLRTHARTHTHSLMMKNQPTWKHIKHYDERVNGGQHKASIALCAVCSVLSSIPFMTRISLQRYDSYSHNALSLLWTDSSSTLISHGTSTYYSISSSSPESNIMQPHYLWLIVKQHLCILMGSAWRWAHPHSARHDCYWLTVNKKIGYVGYVI